MDVNGLIFCFSDFSPETPVTSHVSLRATEVRLRFQNELKYCPNPWISQNLYLSINIYYAMNNQMFFWPFIKGVCTSIPSTETTPPCLRRTVWSARSRNLSEIDRVQMASRSSAHFDGKTHSSSHIPTNKNTLRGRFLTCAVSMIAENELLRQSLARRYWQIPLKVKNLLSKVL